jgi:hypothetical protein
LWTADGLPGNRRPVVFWYRQKNVAITAIRRAVNFALTAKMAKIRHFNKIWQESYVKANFFSFMKKAVLKAAR